MVIEVFRSSGGRKVHFSQLRGIFWSPIPCIGSEILERGVGGPLGRGGSTPWTGDLGYPWARNPGNCYGVWEYRKFTKYVGNRYIHFIK